MEQDKDHQFAADFRTAVTRLIKKIRRESPSGQHLSLTERSTMTQLYQHKALLASELAAMEMITNQSMSQVLNHLAELGYIVRTVSETDKRKLNISLSPEGETALLKFRQERDEWMYQAITRACTPEEQELLKQVLTPLTKIIDFK